MRNKIMARLLLLAIFLNALYSCRNDVLTDQKETYNNSSKFQLTSKRISLSESKHKAKLISELEKAEIMMKTLSKTNAQGKVINFGNGLSIDTDEVIYIENGSNYYTYTFNITRENAPVNAPVENLLLTPLPDGTYKEFLLSYDLTQQEKQELKEGHSINVDHKTTITEINTGTNWGTQLKGDGTFCYYDSFSEIKACPCENHTTLEGCGCITKATMYTYITEICEIYENDYTLTPLDPNGTGNGGGGGSGDGGTDDDPPCDPALPTSPTLGMTDANGCPIVIPTLPFVPNPKNPCENIKTQRADPEFKSKVDDVQGKTGLTKETGYIQRTNGQYTYQDNASATDIANSLSLPYLYDIINKTIIGFIHTHVDDFRFTDEIGDEYTKEGIRIFSPADVSAFMDMLKNAQEAGRPLSDIYAVMVSSMNNYQIRFTGNQYQIKTFTKAQRDNLKLEYYNLLKNKKEKAKDLEIGFLKFVNDNMNIKGISLYRMNADGTTTEIKLNADKTTTIESNCPN